MQINTLLYEKVLPAVLWFFIFIHSKLIRMHIHHHPKYSELQNNKKPVIFVFWHGQLFCLIHYMSSPDTYIMASRSNDGRLLASILKKFRFGIVLGSSNKQPVRALVNAIRIMQQGKSMAFAADGPKGPYQQLKPGAIFCAKKIKAPVIPLAVGIKKGWKFRSWDQFILPKYFTRCTLLSGEPIYLDEDLSEKAIKRDINLIETKLNELVREADNRVNTKNFVSERPMPG